MAIRIGDASEVNANRRLIEFRNGSGPQCGVGISASGEIIAYRNTAATVLGTATGVTFSDNVWHYIEIEALIHDGTGFIRVYKDGAQVLEVTNVDPEMAHNLVVYSKGTKTLAPGDSQTLEIPAAAVGEYRMWSDMQGHAAMGQVGAFVVVPAAPSTSSP